MFRSLQLSILFLILLVLVSPQAQAQLKCVEAVSGTHEVPQPITTEYQKEWGHSAKKYYTSYFSQRNAAHDPLMAVFERFGFHSVDGQLQAPSLEEFVTNYTKLLDEKKVPEADRLYPGVAIKRASGKIEILIPSRDTIQISDGDTFDPNPRLKTASFYGAVSNGMYPLFADGFHDLFHFASFALNPSYMKLIKKIFSTISADQVTKDKATYDDSKERVAKFNRNVYMIETLDLGDPGKIPALKSFLLYDFSAHPQATLHDVQRHYDSLPWELVYTHAQKMLIEYTNYFVGYSAANGDRSEKKAFSGFANFDRVEGILLRKEKPDTYYGYFPNSMFTEASFGFFDEHLRRLIETWNFDDAYLQQVKFPSRPELQKLIRLQLAKMEYTLWGSATRLTPEIWARDTIFNPIRDDSPTMQFIIELLGKESALYRILTGR